MKKIYLLILIVVSITTFSSCSSDDDNNDAIIGTWHVYKLNGEIPSIEDPDNPTLEEETAVCFTKTNYVFNENGSVLISEYRYSGRRKACEAIDTYEQRWKNQGNGDYIIETPVKVTFEGDTFTMHYGDDETTTFKKI